MLIAKPGGVCPACKRRIARIEFAYATNNGHRVERNGYASVDYPHKELTFKCPLHGFFTRQFPVESIRYSHQKMQYNEYYNITKHLVGKLVDGVWRLYSRHFSVNRWM